MLRLLLATSLLLAPTARAADTLRCQGDRLSTDIRYTDQDEFAMTVTKDGVLAAKGEPGRLCCYNYQITHAFAQGWEVGPYELWVYRDGGATVGQLIAPTQGFPAYVKLSCVDALPARKAVISYRAKNFDAVVNAALALTCVESVERKAASVGSDGSGFTFVTLAKDVDADDCARQLAQVPGVEKTELQRVDGTTVATYP